MSKLFKFTVVALILGACGDTAGKQETSSKATSTSVKSTNPLTKKSLPDFHELLVANSLNLINVQYSYCVDSHWDKTAKDRQKLHSPRKLSYEEAGEKCEKFASKFSECLTTKGYKISAADIKKGRGYLDFVADKYKENAFTNTGPYIDSNRMITDATCAFVVPDQDFDIAGLKIGMTPEEVTATLTQLGYTLSNNRIKTGLKGPSFEQSVLQKSGKNIPVKEHKTTKMLNLEKDSERVSVRFSPMQNGARAAQITYSLSGNNMDKDAFNKRVIQKYGLAHETGQVRRTDRIYRTTKAAFVDGYEIEQSLTQNGSRLVLGSKLDKTVVDAVNAANVKENPNTTF